MLVTTTEKLNNGVYTKFSTTDINGKQVLLSAISVSGSRFAEKLSQYEDGMNNITIEEVSDEAFMVRGVLQLETSVATPINQTKETVV